jgi:hypothetical protein
MSKLYWPAFSALLLLVIFVSMIAFNFTPIAFLIGAAVLGFGYLGFLFYRKRKSGRWEHSNYEGRVVGSVFLYVALFWTAAGILLNQRTPLEAWARYEPYVTDGVQHGYTFYYLDYANAYERVDSPTLNEYIEEKKPEKVQLLLEVVKDFGKFRSYSVQAVDSIPVNNKAYRGWTGGEPPWPALRTN